MRCGKCKEENVTVDHVRNCYGSDKFAEPGMTKVTDPPMWPASDKQIAYVVGLQKQRVLPDTWLAYDDDTLRKLERDEVSGLITALKEFPVVSRVAGYAVTTWTMPAGRYALLEGDEVGFYKVDRPDKGRWIGYVFIKRLVGSPGDYREVPINANARYTLLDAIDADSKGAMERFGRETMTCGRCGSPLTDPKSRAVGIGPICAGKEW